MLAGVPAYVVAAFTARAHRVAYVINVEEWSGARFNMLEGYKHKFPL